MNTNQLILNQRGVRSLHDDRYGTDEGAVWETAGPITGLVQLSFAHAVVAPGKTLPAHYHALMSEVYHVVSGEGVMTLDGTPHTVRAGDTISLPPGTIHSLTNHSEEPLCLVVATSPAYDPADDHEV
jgi:mannose-6-phosphate isomerase-like protein (cupin superfamily)